MQYTITINQRAAVESGLPLHKDHLPIIECLAHKIGTDRLEVVIEDGREYTWVNHQMIIDDLPLWKFEKRTVQRRIAELEKMEILVRAKGQFKKGRTYYRKGANWNLLYSTPDNSDQTHDKNVTATPDNSVTPPLTNLSRNYNTINSSTNNTYAQFEKFWNEYGKKVDRKRCEAKWKRLSKKQQADCMASLPSYRAYVAANGGVAYQKNPLTYLNGECWETEWKALTQTNKPKQLSLVTSKLKTGTSY